MKQKLARTTLFRVGQNRQITQALSQNHENEIRNIKKYRYCIILPNDCWKMKWDFFISLLIVASAIITPYRMAYVDDNSLSWMITQLVMDGFFFIDIILTFFSAYFDKLDVLVDKRKKIICNYLKFWFIIDFVSILPLSIIIDQASPSVNDLARVARLSRLYKLLKMLKFLKMTRMVKNRQKFLKYLTFIFKTSASIERIIIFTLIFLILCHVASCVWYLIDKLEGMPLNGWVATNGYEYQAPESLYLIGFYFTITTITTVGYGDVSAGTFSERIFCICLMLIGVISYSFAISSFTSVLSTLDSKAAKLKAKLDTLNNIRSEYDMNFELYWKLKQSLYYDHSKDMTDKMTLLRELPGSLKISLSDLMYRKAVSHIRFFKKVNDHFMATVGPLLRPIRILKGEYIYMEEDPADAGKLVLLLVYFIKKGVVNFVKPNPKGPPDLVYSSQKEGAFFGDVDFLRQEDSVRLFSAKAKTDVELFLLTKQDLIDLGRQYKKQLSILFAKSEERLKNLQESKKSAELWYEKLLKEAEEELNQENGLKLHRRKHVINLDVPEDNSQDQQFLSDSASASPSEQIARFQKEEVKYSEPIEKSQGKIKGKSNSLVPRERQSLLQLKTIISKQVRQSQYQFERISRILCEMLDQEKISIKRDEMLKTAFIPFVDSYPTSASTSFLYGKRGHNESACEDSSKELQRLVKLRKVKLDNSNQGESFDEERQEKGIKSSHKEEFWADKIKQNQNDT